jgi:hypothetical protein
LNSVEWKPYMKNRIPSIQEIIPVYAVVSFIIYGWTSVMFFWKLPSYSDFLTPAEIFGALSYSVFTNLIESLILISGLLCLYALLPPRYFRNTFTAFGSIATTIFLVSIMLYQRHYANARLDYTSGIRFWAIVTMIAILLFIFVTAKINFVRTAIVSIADRMVIFLYIFIPLSVICVLDVIIRNLG